MKIITGMHRSASSLVSRLFFEAGADFGPTETMYDANKWNPDGYYEQVDFHTVNIPIVNGPFGNFSYFFLPSRKTVLKRSARFADDIKRISAQYDNNFVKEVRFSLTLPAWLEHGANVEKILICLREPYQVAYSLKLRNKAIIRHGLHLWYVHYRELLENIGDIPSHIISYENLMNPAKAGEETYNAFKFMGLSCSQEKATELCSTIIDESKSDCTTTKNDYPPKIQAMWDKLKAIHNSQ